MKYYYLHLCHYLQQSVLLSTTIGDILLFSLITRKGVTYGWWSTQAPISK